MHAMRDVHSNGENVFALIEFLCVELMSAKKKTRRPPDPLRPLLPYRTAAKASSWRERPGHHLREGAKGLLHVASRSYHYVLGWDKVWGDPPLPDPFTRGSNFEPYLVRPGVSRNLHPGFG